MHHSGKCQGELYSHHVRKQWQSILETRYHFKLLDIELNLASSPIKYLQWLPYRLLFVKGTTGDHAATPTLTANKQLA